VSGSVLNFASTLVATWLGLAVRRAVQQRKAVESIQSLGGRVHYGYQVTFDEAEGITSPTYDPETRTASSLIFSSIRSLLGDDALSSVVNVSLYGPELTNDDLAHLENLQELCTLFIWKADNVTGDALVHLRRLSKLQDLSLGIQMTDQVSSAFVSPGFAPQSLSDGPQVGYGAVLGKTPPKGF